MPGTARWAEPLGMATEEAAVLAPARRVAAAPVRTHPWTFSKPTNRPVLGHHDDASWAMPMDWPDGLVPATGAPVCVVEPRTRSSGAHPGLRCCRMELYPSTGALEDLHILMGTTMTSASSCRCIAPAVRAMRARGNDSS